MTHDKLIDAVREMRAWQQQHPGASWALEKEYAAEAKVDALLAALPPAEAAPILLQDETQTSDSKKLSQWFAGKPNARQEAREAAAEAAPVAPVGLSDEPSGPAPFGIIDPDYARIFTKARILAWSYGFACVAHGSFTRDLDLLLVPWTEQATPDSAKRIIRMLVESCDLRMDDKPADKPHGRRAYSLHLKGFGEPRWVDLSILAASPATAPQASEPSLTVDCPHCGEKAGRPCIWPDTTQGRYRDLPHEARTALAATQAPQASADAQDAARYRYLRDVAWNQGSLIFYAERYGPEDWDSHIDAALQGAKP